MSLTESQTGFYLKKILSQHFFVVLMGIRGHEFIIIIIITIRSHSRLSDGFIFMNLNNKFYCQLFYCGVSINTCFSNIQKKFHTNYAYRVGGAV